MPYFSRLSRDTSGHLPTIAGFLEIFAAQGEFGLCVGVDQFGFAIIANIGKDDVTLRLESHNTTAEIRFTGSQSNRFSDVFLRGVFRESRRKKGSILRRGHIFKLHIFSNAGGVVSGWLVWTCSA